MKRRLALLSIPFLVAACHDGPPKIYTNLWHSATCHPEMYYVGPPPNAAPECNWQPVYPPPPGITIP